MNEPPDAQALATDPTAPTPAPGPAPTPFTAEFDVSVVYNEKTYTLQVVPKSVSAVYGVLLQEAAATGTPKDIVKFAIKDKENWRVEIDLPIGPVGVTVGKATFQTVDFSFGQGDAVFPVPTPPTPPK